MTDFATVGAERLLRLADILDAADEEHERKHEPRYDQGYWTHPCGTPACALGHYAHHTRERWTFNWWGRPRLTNHAVEPTAYPSVAEEFGIDSAEYIRLFGGSGCDNAQTAKQAAAYIRDFVRRKMMCGG